MHGLTSRAATRALALVSIGLVVYAQLRSVPGDVDRPFTLAQRFVFFPAGWSLTIFLAFAAPWADRLKLAGALAVAALAGAGLSGEAGALTGAMTGVCVTPYLFSLYRIAQSRGEARQDWIDRLALGALIHVTALAIPYFRDRTALDLPNIVDANIATFDEAFGLQISNAMSLALVHAPALRMAAFSAYALVQIPIVIIAAVNFHRSETRALCVLPAFMVASMIGFVCYHLAPGIGPKCFFGDDNPVLHANPALLSHLPSVDFDPHRPRNAMPSLHFTWALLVFLFSRGLPFPARVLAFTFTALTFVATLGFREHYFMDLVVALPLTLLTRSLCAVDLGWRSPARATGVALGFAMLATWIGLIPFAMSIAAPFVVALAILTSATALTYESQLASAQSRERAAARPPVEAALAAA